MKTTDMSGEKKIDWLGAFAEDAEQLSPADRRWVGYWDPVFFCRWYLGEELIPSRMPWVHRGVLAILTRKCEFLMKYGELDKIISNFVWKSEGDQEHQVFSRTDDGHLVMEVRRFTAIMLPRGLAKTTIAGIAVPTYKLAYKESQFTVYVSEASTHARMQLEAVKSILSYNERFLQDFGELRPKMSADEKWSQDMFETNTGVAMFGQGRGGQVRGKLHKGRRPDEILVDDVEDKESVATEEGRKKSREWFWADVIPALPKVKKTGTITMLGTMLHPDAILNRLRNDPLWSMIEFGAYDKQGDLLWPEWMNEDELKVNKDSYQVQGLLHIFYMEYFNTYRAPEKQPFKQEYFHYGEPPKNIQTAIYLDPAISERRSADRTCIIVAGIAEDGKIYVLETWFKRGAGPQEIIDQYFLMAQKWECNAQFGHGFEAVAYQAALTHIMKEYMFRKNYYFKPIEIKHAGRDKIIPAKKQTRIQLILAARYSAGYIWHLRPFIDLETELLDFPLGKDDGPDCLAGCVSLLDPFASEAAGDTDLSKDQYPPLSEIFKGDWRWA